MNCGALAHRFVNSTCRTYFHSGRALVSFCGPEWVNVRPVKGRPGTFAGIQKRGPVDYIGHDAKGRGFRFDLKASAGKVSINLATTQVPRHQVDQLEWCHKHDTPSGLLVARFHHRIGHVSGWYWLPSKYLFETLGPAGTWRSVKWSKLSDDGLKVPHLTCASYPDFLDSILGP